MVSDLSIAKNPPGLRALKKHRTREAILREAYVLFNERGYEATTIAEIARRVEIAPSTVLGYFSTKDAIFFSELDTIIDDFERFFAERQEDSPALQIFEDWYREGGRSEGWRRTGGEHAESRALWTRMLFDSPILTGLALQRISRVKELLAEGFAEDFADSKGDLRPQIVAGVVTEAMWAAARCSATSGSSKDLSEFLDYALESARATIQALKCLPRPEF
jgi:AcrR family transcriptional regulator